MPSFQTAGLALPLALLAAAALAAGAARAEPLPRCSVRQEPDLAVQPGARMTLRFASLRIRSLLSILSEESGVPIYATESVEGSLSLNVSNMAWRQILDMVLKRYRWTAGRLGGALIVGPAPEVDAVIERNLFR